MNPFEEIEDNITTKHFKIEIWLEAEGRKKNTYLSGWDIEESLLKEHIKTMKKKNGCNGTIKDLKNIAGEVTDKNVLHLQGDHVDFILNYIKTHEPAPKTITIRG